MSAFEAMLDIVDFVEERGGSLGQEERNRLVVLVLHYSKAIFVQAVAHDRTL